MDTGAADWLFDTASPAEEDLFTLPANIPTSSLWNSSLPFPDLAFPLDPFPPPLPAQLQHPVSDDLSDVTDVLEPPSPSIHNPNVDQEEPYQPPESTPRKEKPHAQTALMPALRLRAARGVLASHPAQAMPSEGAVLSDEAAHGRSLGDDGSRQRHNATMRENRGRFNRKFGELTSLLEMLSAPLGKENAKPMKNKIQILERAMLQYGQMETERARCKNELLFGGEGTAKGREGEVIATAVGAKEACLVVVRALCAGQSWKYGEVWTEAATGGTHGDAVFELEAAFVSPRNMPATRAKLEAHARRLRVSGSGSASSGFLQQVARLRHATWVGDVRRRRDGGERAAAGVSTSLAMPVRTMQGEAGVVVVMHADDELLAFPGGVRPYDRESVGKITELARAVGETWAGV